MSLATDCEALPSHVEQACNDFRKGGISAVAIIDTVTSIGDFTIADHWNTAITAGTVRIIKNIKAVFPKAKAIEGENVVACGSEKMLDGFDGTITWKDFNVNSDNDNFYAALAQKKAFIAIYNCVTQEIRIVDQLCWFNPGWAEVPEGQKDKQKYEVTAMWYAPVGWFPSLYNAPPGIFE